MLDDWQTGRHDLGGAVNERRIGGLAQRQAVRAGCPRTQGRVPRSLPLLFSGGHYFQASDQPKQATVDNISARLPDAGLHDQKLTSCG